MSIVKFHHNYSLPTRKHIFFSILTFILAVTITKVTVYCFFQDNPQPGKPGTISLVVDTKRSGFQQSTSTRLEAMAAITTPISAKLEEATGPMIAAELTRQCGKTVTIESKPGQEIVISLDIKNVSMRDVLRFLSDNYQDAVVQIAGYDFTALDSERRALFGTRDIVFSINVNDVPLREVVQIVQSLSSNKINFDEREGARPVTLHLEKTTVRELVQKIYEQTGSKLTIEN